MSGGWQMIIIALLLAATARYWLAVVGPLILAALAALLVGSGFILLYVIGEALLGSG